MIDVFICTYNPNLDYLRLTIESILKQDCGSSLWKLKIIDNNSSFKVKELRFISDLGIEVIEEPTPGLTAARKCALEHSRADFLLFVDDDNVLENTYISNALVAFEDSSIGILSGKIHPIFEVNPPEWFIAFEEMIAIRHFVGDKIIFNESLVYSNLFPIGAGMVIRRTLMEKYYNQHLNPENYIEGRKGSELSSGEDMDLDFYAMSENFRIGVLPTLFLQHLIPKNRIEISYLERLAKSSMKSTYQLNEKWKTFFHTNVFDCFNESKVKIVIKLSCLFFLKFIFQRYRVSYVFNKELLKYC